MKKSLLFSLALIAIAGTFLFISSIASLIAGYYVSAATCFVLYLGMVAYSIKALYQNLVKKPSMEIVPSFVVVTSYKDDFFYTHYRKHQLYSESELLDFELSPEEHLEGTFRDERQAGAYIATNERKEYQVFVDHITEPLYENHASYSSL